MRIDKVNSISYNYNGRSIRPTTSGAIQISSNADVMSFLNFRGLTNKVSVSQLRPNLTSLSHEQLLNFLEKTPEKVNSSDLAYFIKNKIALTKYDTKKIIENRLRCLETIPYNETDDEYINNIGRILNTEFQKLEKVPNDRKIIIVSGIPACGKSEFIKHNYKSDEYYLADVDIIKSLFPAYEKDGKYLNNLHKLSQRILHYKILPAAIMQGKNAIIPTTGLNDYVEQIATPAKEYGYNVEQIHIVRNKSEAMKSAIERFEDTGRFVDPFFILLRASQMAKQGNGPKEAGLLDKKTIINSIAYNNINY